MHITIKKALPKDIHIISNFIADAQKWLANQKIDQWQDGYPPLHILQEDIQKQNSYLAISDTNTPLATVMFSTDNEPTYTHIQGKWLTSNNAKYGVIHRLAMGENNRSKGISKLIFNYFENYLKQAQIKSMRIDTHADNVIMQSLLKNLNYSYCGIITLNSGTTRLAFEKLLD